MATAAYSVKSSSYNVRAVRSEQLVVGSFDNLVISFHVIETSGIEPFNATFLCTIVSGNPPYDYSYDFGDATFSSESEPVHTYTSAGNYTASVTVTDSQGRSVSSSLEIIVEEAPVIPLSAEQYDFFASPGDSITLNALGGNGSYYWVVADSDSGGYFDQNGQAVSLFLCNSP